MYISLKAPGKLMLIGEHAVVYGYPCLVTAINRYITAHVSDAAQNEFILHGYDTKIIEKTVEYMQHTFKRTKSVRIETTSELQKFGLGSSSATAVSVTAALLKIYGVTVTSDELFRHAYQAYLTVNQKASGFDVAASTYGKTILFDGKKKSVETVSVDPLPLVVGYTGIKIVTGVMVRKVNRLKNNNPKLVDRLFHETEILVKKSKLAVEQENWQEFGKYCNESHDLLKKLKVSSTTLDTLVTAAVDAGAYGAKLSGAGGGDCMFAVVSDQKKAAVKEAISHAGGNIIDTVTSVQGVSAV